MDICLKWEKLWSASKVESYTACSVLNTASWDTQLGLRVLSSDRAERIQPNSSLQGWENCKKIWSQKTLHEGGCMMLCLLSQFPQENKDEPPADGTLRCTDIATRAEADTQCIPWSYGSMSQSQHPHQSSLQMLSLPSSSCSLSQSQHLLQKGRNMSICSTMTGYLCPLQILFFCVRERSRWCPLLHTLKGICMSL